MKHTPSEEGWVMPLALMGLAVVSAVTTSAWHQARQRAEGFGYLQQHERSRQAAHAQLQAAELAWQHGFSLPTGVVHRNVLSTDLGWPPPHRQLHRFTAIGQHGDSRVVVESTWAQALDEHGQPRSDTPPERWAWREIWP